MAICAAVATFCCALGLDVVGFDKYNEYEWKLIHYANRCLQESERSTEKREILGKKYMLYMPYYDKEFIYIKEGEDLGFRFDSHNYYRISAHGKIFWANQLFDESDDNYWVLDVDTEMVADFDFTHEYSTGLRKNE